MAYRSNKGGKAMDFLLKDPKDLQYSKLDPSGYRWALNHTCRVYTVNPNEMELLLLIYKFTFVSANALRKRFPASANYIEKAMEKMVERTLIRKLYNETEINIEHDRGTHLYLEARTLRKRYQLTTNGIKLVGEFFDKCNDFRLSEDRVLPEGFRKRTGQITPNNLNTYKKKMGKPLGGKPAYFEEDFEDEFDVLG